MTDIYFPPRELEVMSILWRLGSATVAEVRLAPDAPLAYKSVSPSLQSLAEKGLVPPQTPCRASPGRGRGRCGETVGSGGNVSKLVLSVEAGLWSSLVTTTAGCHRLRT